MKTVTNAFPKLTAIAGVASLVLVANIGYGGVISDFNGGGPGQPAIDQTAGFTFNVGASSMIITQLGIWDYLGDGLAEPHDVGLWDDGGNLLASVTIPVGTSAALLNGFRYEPITAVALSPNATYVLGAFYFDLSLDFLRLQTTASIDPGFTFGEARATAGAALAFPSGGEPPGDDGFFGPNAIVAVADGPPGWATLPVIILLAFVAAKRRQATAG